MLAKHAIHEADQNLERRPRGLAVWLALAIVARLAIATIFISFLVANPLAFSFERLAA